MGEIREFPTGATRDAEEGKLDYEGFCSPLVLKRFAEYMDKHRQQSDGTLRASDNWQKGIPADAYMKSLWRHFMDVWLIHRGNELEVTMEEALCACLFNVQGYLHERLKEGAPVKASEVPQPSFGPDMWMSAMQNTHVQSTQAEANPAPVLSEWERLANLFKRGEGK